MIRLSAEMRAVAESRELSRMGTLARPGHQAALEHVGNLLVRKARHVTQIDRLIVWAFDSIESRSDEPALIAAFERTVDRRFDPSDIRIFQVQCF